MTPARKPAARRPAARKKTTAKRPTKKVSTKRSTAKKAPAKKKATTKKPAKKAPPKQSASARGGGRRYWLVKTEPNVYSIDDLARDGKTMWDGVRNYQARNLMRDEMRPGDPVLIYHSNADPMAIVGLAEVAGPSYPDPTAFDRKDKHFDPKSDPDAPTWMLVDVAFVDKFPAPLDRQTLADVPALADMMLLRRGSRLSVQPVTAAEYKAVLALAKRKARA